MHEIVLSLHKFYHVHNVCLKLTKIILLMLPTRICYHKGNFGHILTKAEKRQNNTLMPSNRSITGVYIHTLVSLYHIYRHSNSFSDCGIQMVFELQKTAHVDLE